MDKNVLYQIDIREWLENSFGSEVMIPVYGSKKMKDMMFFTKLFGSY